MNEVSKKSVNGGSQVSGGYIFDQMDRFAHDYLKKMYKIKGYLFTQRASINYFLQICSSEDFEYKVIEMHQDDFCLWRILVALIHKGKHCASAAFTFVEKDHAYCDTKGE